MTAYTHPYLYSLRPDCFRLACQAVLIGVVALALLVVVL